MIFTYNQKWKDNMESTFQQGVQQQSEFSFLKDTVTG